MGLFPYGAQCCNNCRHWQCHAKRTVRGNPPKEIYTDSNCDKCSRTGRATLSKDCCSAFAHLDGATITFPLNNAKDADKHFDSPVDSVAYAMTEGMDEPAASFLRATMEYTRERSALERKRQEAEPARCRKCGGTGKIRCYQCGGSGKTECEKCSGKGGFSTTLEIKEERKVFTRRTATLIGVQVEDDFWKQCWDWDKDSEAIAEQEDCHVVCSKEGQASVSDEMRSIQDKLLKVSAVGGDFCLPHGLPEGERAGRIESHLEAFGKYVDKCKEIEQEATKWGGGWGYEHRLKEASVEITETPCIAQVEFRDRFGFRRTALVNLASEKVYVNAVTDEERERRLPELVKETQNNPDLQNAIGQMYAGYYAYKGYAPKDEELAVGWFLRAAKTGHADAMDNLGNCYKNGDGVEKDEELAAAWYAKAAKAGLPWGQYHYADVLEDGKGVPKDDKLAVAWYLKAAKQGLADAQWRLGCRIADGRGTAKDEELGEAWKERAKANGFEPPRSSGW